MPEAQSETKTERTLESMSTVASSSFLLMMPAGNIVRLRSATRGTGRVRCMVRLEPSAWIDSM